MSYAAMLTPDPDKARRLTDAAIVSVMGSLRAPRSELERELAIHERISRAYLDSQRAEAATGHAEPFAALPTGASAAHTSPGNDAYAPPEEGDDATTRAWATDDTDPRPLVERPAELLTPLASALADLTPTERVAALAWWIDGATTAEVADRLGSTLNSAIDALHRAGVALAAATGDTAPTRDHFASGGDVVTVEISGAGGRR
ncbi:hypothetical protein [Demequina aurantiaca]|uniref:hypothetical protein n=1 Tax=Demequina aurantiaca TaxID=676200 RepID=UPI003D333260